MDRALVIDTDILIDCLRGRQQATDFLEGLASQPMVSVLSVAELYVGARDTEMEDLARFLAALGTVPLTDEIARAGGRFRRDYGRSHGTGLIDGLVAATANALGARLATLNRRHYPMLDDVLVPYEAAGGQGGRSMRPTRCG